MYVTNARHLRGVHSASGLSLQDFAAQHGIKYASLAKWIKSNVKIRSGTARKLRAEFGKTAVYEVIDA